MIWIRPTQRGHDLDYDTGEKEGGKHETEGKEKVKIKKKVRRE